MAFGITDAQRQAMAQAATADPTAEDPAAQALALDENHLVEYADACVQHTKEVDKDRLQKMEIMWEAHESIMREYANKDAYQSKMVLNEPYQTCMQATALVRRAVMEKPDYFDVVPRKPGDQLSRLKAQFWEEALKYWTTTTGCRMTTVYPSMAHMSFAVGISMAAKALWQTGPDGRDQLRLALVEPWKIFRDPDARPMQPQSGLYTIHQDYVDLYQLKDGALAGIYQNVDRVREGKTETTGNELDDEKSRKRRGQFVHRNKYRKSVLVTEFWGDILDDNGDLVLANQTFTTANGVLIRGPFDAPFPHIRWPIHQFSCLPHLMRFAGYGLYEGVMHIWKLRNNLLNMYIDNENWRLNQAFEVDPSKLENPADTELYPGKLVRKRMGADGVAYVPLQVPDLTGDFSAFFDITDKIWQNGSFVTELMMGESGNRKQITAREVEIKVSQGLGVFDNIGKDVELGGVQLLEMIKDVLLTYWDDFDTPSWADVFGQQSPLLQVLGAQPMFPQERIQFLDVDTDFRIAGVTQIFDRSAQLDKLMNFANLTNSPRFGMYVKDYDLLSKAADAIGTPDLMKTPEEVMQMMAMKQQMMQQQAAQQAQVAGHPPPPGGGPGGPGGPPPPHPGGAAGGPPPAAFGGPMQESDQLNMQAPGPVASDVLQGGGG